MLPLHLLDRDSARKIANPRPPGSRGGCSRDSWRFARRVGNVGAVCAAAGDVQLARIRQAQSLKLVTEST
jgi:hypothetical protein